MYRDAPSVKNPVGQVVMWHVVACRRRPAAPSDLPKSGGAAAPPAPALGASLHIEMTIKLSQFKIAELGSTNGL